MSTYRFGWTGWTNVYLVSTSEVGISYSGVYHETSLLAAFLDGLSQLPLAQPETFLLCLLGLRLLTACNKHLNYNNVVWRFERAGGYRGHSRCEDRHTVFNLSTFVQLVVSFGLST